MIIVSRFWKQSKSSHLHAREPSTTIFSRLENKASSATHKLESQGQSFSASLETQQTQSLTTWRAKHIHFQQAWKQSKSSHSPSKEPRTTIFSRPENKASLVTHLLETQGQPFSESLKIKQAHSLTSWRVKHNHFQQVWKHSKPSHSHSGEPKTTIFSRLENKSSPVTHLLGSQGQPFSAGLRKKASPVTHKLGEAQPFSVSLKTKQAPVTHSLKSQGQPFSVSWKTKQAQSLTFWRAKHNHFQQT